MKDAAPRPAREHRRTHAIAWVRVGTGPLALWAFFLPLAHGPSLLEAYRYSGFELVTLTGRLQSLDLEAWQSLSLWVLRISLLCVPIAGAWQTLLSPFHSWHPGYHVSGWFLAVVTLLLVVFEVVRRGAERPAPGLMVLVVATAGFLIAWGATRAAGGDHRSTKSGPSETDATTVRRAPE